MTQRRRYLYSLFGRRHRDGDQVSEHEVVALARPRLRRPMRSADGHRLYNDGLPSDEEQR
ncbi:MAG: hypothetical protein ACYDGN_17900 [Acidimicrobiales bacterium]